MMNKELAAALRLCGSTPEVERCQAECPFYKGANPELCVPKMTAACADALENHERHVATLQKAIEDLRARLPRWIPVTERMPDVGKDVLTLGTAGAVRTMRLNKGGRDWSFEVSRWHGFLIPRNSVTHWMPIPEPPSTEEVK